MYKNAILIAAVLAFAAAVTPPVYSQSVLMRGNHQDPASLDPQRISTVYENNIVLDLFEGLTTVDAAGRPIPGVAESWTVSDDGLTWKFNLQDDLVWSDGVPLTADDVVYSFRRLMDPATASQYPYLFYAIAGAEAVNRGSVPLEKLGVEARQNTVILRLESPLPILPELLSNGFATIVPKHVVELYGDRWTTPGVMVTNGAFVLEDWRPQDRVTLSRNELYRDAQLVSLNGVVYLPTEDQSAALARFRAGELDTNLEFPTARTRWLTKNLPDETRIADYLITFYLSFNTNHPALADVRVRRALSLAIDRQTLAERVLRSGESAASSFVPPSVAGYTPATTELNSSSAEDRINQSRTLLSEAGFGPENPLRLTYSLSSAEDRRRVATAIAAMWRPLGVEITLNNTEGKVLFSRLRSGDFEIGYSAWAADVNDAANFLIILHSRSKNSNYARFRNARYDTLLNKAAATAELETRTELLSHAEALMLSEAPIAPLFHGVSKNLVARYVQGWTDNPRDVHISRFLRLSTQPNAK